jgi:hypothetical protein
MQIPKARALLHGDDINAAVIAVQKTTGVEITPQWWAANIDNNATPEQMASQFDAAYARDFGAEIANK